MPGIQIEEAFNRPPPKRNIPGACVPRELQARCLRLVVSVRSLATGGNRLLEPDVLSKDLAAYIEAPDRCPLGTPRPRYLTLGRELRVVDGKQGHHANRPSAVVPGGFGDKKAIRAILVAEPLC